MVDLGKCAVVGALMLALVACSDSPDEPGATQPSEEPTTAAQVATMQDVCPQIEAALPNANDTGEEWRAFLEQVESLSGTADLESQNALAVLKPGGEAMIRLNEEGGRPLGAEMDLADSLNAFARRCQAAGSSAFG